MFVYTVQVEDERKPRVVVASSIYAASGMVLDTIEKSQGWVPDPSVILSIERGQKVDEVEA